MIFNVSGGGGTALNFRVVGGTTAPSNPKENTIWVNTNTDITSWVFSATQPTAASGKVWIAIGTSSAVEFNALKKNGIQVYPLTAKQYVSGAWVDKTAKSYQVGAWVGWMMFLYKYGNEYTDITGGWVAAGKNVSSAPGDTASTPTITRNETNLYCTISGNSVSGIIYMGKTIDLTNFSTLRAEGEFNIKSQNADVNRLAVWSAIGKYGSDNLVAYTKFPTQSTSDSIEVDVKSLTGKYYVGFIFSTAASGLGTYLKMESLVLE